MRNMVSGLVAGVSTDIVLGVLMTGVPGTRAPTWLREALDRGLAGVCLFAENTPDLAATRRLTDALGEHSNAVLIAVDEEGGDVSRLESVAGSQTPGNAALGAVDDIALTEQTGLELGRLLATAGCNLNLAPVLDVTSNPANPVVGVRSFGESANLVIRHGRALVDGLHAAGIAACGKHFPGHGDTAIDSHVGLPTISVDAATFVNRDLAPFAALAPKLDAIMTGHLLVPHLGQGPASVSRWSTDLLRDLAFDGVVITDALGMAAVSRGGIGAACVRALQAGADLLCLDSPSNRDPEATLIEAICAISRALNDGDLEASALAASAERNRRLALQYPTRKPECGAAAIGLDTARRALRWRGAVVSRGPTRLVDVRSGHSFASGPSGPTIVEGLARLRADLGLSPLTTDTNARLVVLTRNAPADPAEASALAEVLATDPEAIVVHVGAAIAAPQARNLICTFGQGRVNAQAMAELISGVAVPSPQAKGTIA